MHEFINSTEKLENALKVFENEKFIAVDTEFIRESTYFSKLCLIQLATEKNIVLIDPLENNINLKSLWKLFNEKETIKVMHSGRQDMEIFYNINNKLPTPVYDTQIAAMVCGFGDQISYENLVKSLLNVNLEKSAAIVFHVTPPPLLASTCGKVTIKSSLLPSISVAVNSTVVVVALCVVGVPLTTPAARVNPGGKVPV